MAEDKRCSVPTYKSGDDSQCHRGLLPQVMSLSCHAGTFRASSAAQERAEEVCERQNSRFYAQGGPRRARRSSDFFAEVEILCLCGPLPSDKEHGFPQPSPRRPDVRGTAGLPGRHHVQHPVGVRG